MINRNYGNHSRRQSRQAIDGILNAPANRGRGIYSNAPASPAKPNFQDRLKVAQTRQRTIGDFKQNDGYHSADRTERGRIQARPETTLRSQPKKQLVAETKHIRQQFTPESKHGRARTRKRFVNEHRQHRKKRAGWRTWVLRSSVTACVMLVIGAGIFGYVNFSKIFQGGGAAAALNEDVDPSKLRGEGDGRVNILLLGRGGAGHDGADLTDTLLVASVDPVNKKMAFVSVPRDLWVEGKYSESKINAVFANAKNAELSDGKSIEEAEKVGVRATEQVIQEVLGINIHYYGMIDFAGFERAINTVGGVTIDAPEQLRDPTIAWENDWDPIIVTKGTQTLDGKTALLYARSRYTSSGGDFDRAERQRILLTALKNEVSSSSTYTNPVKVSQLVADFAENAKTDFGLNDIMRLQEIMKDVKTIDSIGLTNADDTTKNYLTTGPYAGQSVVLPVAGMFSYDAIKLFIRSSLPDGYITRENAPIRIMNGTTVEGGAQQKADELSSYKYNVVGTENAPTKDYAKTILVDLTGANKYTLHYLERRLGIQATSELPDGITLTDEQRKGFIIIIGRNEASTR